MIQETVSRQYALNQAVLSKNPRLRFTKGNITCCEEKKHCLHATSIFEHKGRKRLFGKRY